MDKLLFIYPVSVPPPSEPRSGAYLNLYKSLGMNSEVNANTKALTSTEILVTHFRIRYHIPMVLEWATSGLLKWDTKLMAFTRIRITEVRRANRGPSGKAATNIVANPYCRTVKQKMNESKEQC